MNHQVADQINAVEQSAADKKPWNTPRIILGMADATMAPLEIVGVPDSRDPYGYVRLNAS